MFRQETELSTEDVENMPRGREQKFDPEIDPAAELPPPDEEGMPDSAGPQAAGYEGAAEAPVPGPNEFERVKAERDQLLDRLARLQADFENARKRAERERIENREYAMGSIVEQFLPVLDNFELALKSNGTAEQLRSGVELIVKQMEEVLSRMQVTVVPAVGEAFDPRMHEALGAIDRDDVPDQHVVEEVRRGYRLRDRLIRPALVRLAHNSKQVED
jgi:molecular chaperone GrpE